MRLGCAASVFYFSDCTSFSNPALAQMSIFQTAMFVQMHYPNDKVVWLDFTKRRYYSEGQRWVISSSFCRAPWV
jgi:hypothetical protein